jgi:hypothetical protein
VFDYVVLADLLPSPTHSFFGAGYIEQAPAKMISSSLQIMSREHPG